jgi:hypothetical protein
MLAVPNKGAVCVIGPSCAVRETPAYVFAREWMKAAFAVSGVIRVGDAYLAAKQSASLLVQDQPNEVGAMAMIGDPCIQMDVGFLPIVGTGGPGAAPPRPLMIQSGTIPSRTIAFTLYPPAAGAYVVTVVDVAGRVLERTVCTALTSGTQLPIRLTNSNAESGVYFAIARGNGATATAKTVVVR